MIRKLSDIIAELERPGLLSLAELKAIVLELATHQANTELKLRRDSLVRPTN